MEQNYFQFQQKYFKKKNRKTSYGSTNIRNTSRSIYPKHGTQIYPILLKHKIIGYFRYADDILLIYNQNKTNIEEMLGEFNKQPTIKFTTQKRNTQIHKLPRPINTMTRAETRIHIIQKTHTNRHHNTK
jgi:hypothetical protein